MESLKDILKRASHYAKVIASRKKIQIAVSENGKVLIGTINNRGKVIYKSLNSK